MTIWKLMWIVQNTDTEWTSEASVRLHFKDGYIISADIFRHCSEMRGMKGRYFLFKTASRAKQNLLWCLVGTQQAAVPIADLIPF